MVFKKIIGLVTAMTICASICCVSVSATGMTTDNYSVGGGNVKGAQANGTVWTRVHTGANDATRTSATETVNAGQSAGDGTQIIQAYTNVSASDCSFVHARFRVNCTNSWGIRIRQADDSNTQWMVFSNDGAVRGNGGTAVNLGTGWNVSTGSDTRVNTVDMVVNPNTGAGYCFVNGSLASYTKNLQTDGTWHGYLIYTSGSWSEGDNLKWQYDNNLGESGKGSSYTGYVDTAEYALDLIDILNDKGLSTTGLDKETLTPISSNKTLRHWDNVENKGRTKDNAQRSGSANFVTHNYVKIIPADTTNGLAKQTSFLRAFNWEGAQYATGKFIHFRFSLKMSNSSGINPDMTLKQRRAGSNVYLMCFKSDGYVYPGSTKDTQIGGRRSWSYGTEYYIDEVVDVENGVMYVYIDRDLFLITNPDRAVKRDGEFEGIHIYTGEDNGIGGSDAIYLGWGNQHNNGGNKEYAWTYYNDTAKRTITLADVFADQGLELDFDEAATVPTGGVLDIGEDLKLRDVSINAEDGYIKTGDRKIHGENVYLNNEGKIRLQNGYNATVERDNGDGTYDKGFMIGMVNPSGILNMTLYASGSAYGKELTDEAITIPFNFNGYEIEGLANFGFTLRGIPDTATVVLHSVE